MVKFAEGSRRATTSFPLLVPLQIGLNMATAREKMTEAADKIARHPEAVSHIGAVYKFVLEGEGGGTWILNLTERPSLVEGEGEAQCTVRLAAKDYVDLMEGRAAAPALFFGSKLKIEGDLGLAMKLGALASLLH